MKLTKFAPIVLGVCALAGASAYAQDVIGGKSVNILPDQLKFQAFGAKGVDPKTEITAANAFGTFNQTPHGAFFRFSPGFVSPLHSHTYDYYAVVLKGTMQNYEVGVKPIDMGPGAFWYQIGKKAHTTTCISKTECEIFIVQSHGFDAQIPPKED
jgi:quercetin dioxygenase-like cupin family protein